LFDSTFIPDTGTSSSHFHIAFSNFPRTDLAMAERFSPYKSPSKGKKAPVQDPLLQPDTPTTNHLSLTIGGDPPIRHTWIGPPKEAKERVAAMMSMFKCQEQKNIILLEQRRAQSQRIVSDFLIAKVEAQEEELRCLREEKAAKELQGIDLEQFFNDPERKLSTCLTYFCIN
jgi:hypothetical protein